MIVCKLPPDFPLELHFHCFLQERQNPVTIEVTGFDVAGAEGLEPSARGFGVLTDEFFTSRQSAVTIGISKFFRILNL